MDKSLSESERWRARFLDLSDSSERMEREWRQQRDSWHRALLTVTVLAEGQDEQLDVLLAELRNWLRKEHKAPSTDKLSASLESLEKRQNLQQQQLLEQLDRSAEQLLGLGLSENQQQRLRSLRKKLHSQSNSAQELLRLMTEWLTLLPQEGARQAPIGLFSRIFKPAGKATELSEGLSFEQPATNSKPASNEREEQLKQQDSGVQRDLCQSMLKMLDQLQLSDQQQQQADTLREMLLAKPDLDAVVGLLERLTELVVAVLAASQNALQSFLSNLDDQLINLQHQLAHECFNVNGGQDARNTLSNSVTASVNELQSIASDDVANLGNQVQTHLQAIVEAMASFERHERDREQQQQQQIQSLTERLADVEKQASATRKAFEHQQQMAYRDSLTGLPNRHAYSDYTRKLWAKIDDGLAVSLAVVDVDLFKRINDQFGHQVGDRVLKLIAKTLSKKISPPHFLARYGGEEFVLILQGLAAEEARRTVENLRKAIAVLPYHFKGDPVQITVSLGVTTVQRNERLDAVFERADKALYQAKQQGRNRVVMA